MNFLENFCKILSELTGINQTFITLTTYTIIMVTIIDLITRGITFLNTQLNKNEKAFKKNSSQQFNSKCHS